MSENGTCQIMFVGAETGWLRFALETLGGQGVRARSAQDLGKADRALKLVFGPQLVFVDVKFAERAPDRFQLFTQRANRYVVVMFPTNLVPYRMSRVFKLGAYDCVDKPYDAQTLVSLVGSLVEEVCSSASESSFCWAPNCVPAI